MAVALPSRTVMAVSAAAAAGLGAGGYLLGRETGTEEARTAPVPALTVPKGAERPPLLLPGATPVKPTVRAR